MQRTRWPRMAASTPALLGSAALACIGHRLTAWPRLHIVERCRKYLLYSRKIFAPGDVLVDGQGPHQLPLLLARAGREAEPDGHRLGHLDVELVEGGAAVVTIYPPALAGQYTHLKV